MIRQNYGYYGCSVTNRTRFYFSRIYIRTARYVTLRYVRVENRY